MTSKPAPSPEQKLVNYLQRHGPVSKMSVAQRRRLRKRANAAGKSHNEVLSLSLSLLSAKALHKELEP